MKHEEIKEGEKVVKGTCVGTSSLSCTQVFAPTCATPSNLNSCEDATNLKTKAAAGKVCCGGGTLSTVAAVSTSCGGQTSLCDSGGETLK